MSRNLEQPFHCTALLLEIENALRFSFLFFNVQNFFRVT